LRIKEQETHLTLQEHDDDDDDEIVKAYKKRKPIPLVGQSKAWVSGRSLARIVGSNTVGEWILSLLIVVSRHVEVSVFVDPMSR